MPIDSLIEDARWTALDLATLADAALAATCARLSLDPDTLEVTLMACDDARIAALNGDFRAKDQPTNVLSWPATDLAAATPGAAPHSPKPDVMGEMMLGDIAISYDTCAREAKGTNTPFAAHTSHLIVHALLHLLGYDHVDDRDATLMERLEVEILGTLGLDDPY